MQTISKLFAEIGFKVDTSGLKSFQAQMKSLSTGIKTQIQDSKAQQAASKAVEAAHKADTAEIKKGIAQQGLKKSAIQADTAELRKLDLQQRMETRAQRAADAQRQRSISSLRSFAVGISAAAYAVTKLTQQTRAHALAYRDYIFQTGMPLKNLQQFEAAAAQVAPGLSGEQIASELTDLQQNLTSIKYAKGNIRPYQMLGISAATRDAITIVDSLRDRIKGLQNPDAIHFLQDLGLSKDWLYLLRMTREEMDKIQAVMLSPEQVKATTRMSLALNQLKFSLSNFRDQIVALNSKTLADLFKNVSDIADAFSKWFKESPNASAFFSTLTLSLSAFLLRAHPLIAALTAILLLLEDYWVATQKGNSLFGWGQDNPNAATSDISYKDMASEIVKKFNPVDMIKDNLSKLTDLPILDKMGKWVSDLLPFSKEDKKTPTTGNVINNNVTMNGYTPQDGGQFIGSLNNKQTSENNMVASQITTIGSL